MRYINDRSTLHIQTAQIGPDILMGYWRCSSSVVIIDKRFLLSLGVVFKNHIGGLLTDHKRRHDREVPRDLREYRRINDAEAAHTTHS